MAKKITNSVIDEATGEIKELSRAYELEDGDVIQTRTQREFFQKKLTRYQDKTPFVWLNFEYGTNIDFSVSKAVAVRFLYFSTACGIDGIVQKQKLKTAKLDMNKNQRTAFLRQTLQARLLRQDGSAFYVDPQTISYGEHNSDSNHIRMYCSNYRQLCESTKTQAELNRIYYFLQMIPYLNRQTNILSHNPIEQDLERIAYMPFNEFCNKIGFDTAHSAKLKKQLSAFRINNELVIGFFDTLTELTATGKNAVLNPKLFFGGELNTQKYRDIRGLFENEKKAYIAYTFPEANEDSVSE